MRQALLFCAILFAASPAFSEDALDFNRDVRPILAANCYECHGPDEAARKAKLRLDQPGAEALTDGEVLYRITTDDSDDIMPPPKANKSLTAEQIETLKRWIDSGAKYDKHWAFVKPTKPEVPQIEKPTGEVRNPIDNFVLAKLEEEKLQPSPEADPYTLVRRLHLDLVGLPPTPQEADAFVTALKKDPEAAYNAEVAKLLESPQYGERWARPWLDLARYADTNGYEKDRTRSIWPYRDWVIRALNDDMPFDQFTIEQLAGDMLPNATQNQKIATGFHRNTMINEEGGIDPLEYRFYAVVDRVLTTGTTWLGLTTGCAQCHTHKYDPITHTDYFALFALLNNADEPQLEVKDSGTIARQNAHYAKIAAEEAKLVKQIDTAKFAAWLEAQKSQLVNWTTLEPTKLEATLPKLTHEGDGIVFASGDFQKRDVYQLEFDLKQPATALKLEVLPDPRLPSRGPGAAYYEGRSGDFFLSELSATLDGQKLEFGQASSDFGKIAVGSGNAEAKNVFDGKGSTGWSTATREGEPHELVLNLKQLAKPGKLHVTLLFERHFVAGLGKFRLLATNSPKPAIARPPKSPQNADSPEIEWQRDYVRRSADFAEARKQLEALEKQRPKIPTTMVMRERQPDNPRETRLHHRGEYLQPKQVVGPAVLEIFEPIPGEPNRLNFAKWVVSDRNPMIGRVTVNRAWQQFFGRGLVASLADFGTQSAPPSHPKLLDWLAIEFVERGWSMKELHRLIVTSATYRQSSIASTELRDRDPGNVLLARGPRFRLDAEVIRDVALKSTGLLSSKMYGPSVFPPQEPTVYASAYGKPKWNPSKGEDRHRRSLYTFAKRTAPFAAFTVFDAPTGEVCTARRERSNTPLQALTMLNDAMFVEMAQALADSAMAVAKTPKERVDSIFRSCLTRPPSETELTTLLEFQATESKRLKNDNLAWMLTARAVLNLDELITKG